MSHETSPGILFINRNAVLGGIERIILTCMQQAKVHGFRPVLACPGNGPLPDHARAMGLDVEVCDFIWMQRTLDPRDLARYALSMRRGGAQVERICRDRNIALLHPHGVVSPLYAVRAARTLRLPVLYHMHDAMTPNRFVRLATRYFRPSVTRVVCVSEASRRVAHGLGYSPDRTKVIYNGISPAFLGPLPEPASEVNGPGPHIGLVGLIVEFKGQHVMLEAAKRVLKQNPTAHFWIIGPLCHPDAQPYLDRLHAMAEDSPLKGHVTFTGPREDVPRWMVAMDVLVMASTLPEALPTVVIEAMALGRPVVATNIGGQLEIIQDRETGLLIPPDDPDALAGALLDILGRPDEDPMGERAAQDARARFTPDRFGIELASVYNQMLHREAVCAA